MWLFSHTSQFLLIDLKTYNCWLSGVLRRDLFAWHSFKIWYHFPDYWQQNTWTRVKFVALCKESGAFKIWYHFPNYWQQNSWTRVKFIALCKETGACITVVLCCLISFCSLETVPHRLESGMPLWKYSKKLITPICHILETLEPTLLVVDSWHSYINVPSHCLEYTSSLFWRAFAQ